jgi:hypothetical protein
MKDMPMHVFEKKRNSGQSEVKNCPTGISSKDNSIWPCTGTSLPTAKDNKSKIKGKHDKRLPTVSNSYALHGTA